MCLAPAIPEGSIFAYDAVPLWISGLLPSRPRAPPFQRCHASSSSAESLWQETWSLSFQCRLRLFVFRRALHVSYGGVVAATRLVMAATRKPWGTGEFAHDIAAVALSWLRIHTPGSSEPLVTPVCGWFAVSSLESSHALSPA